LGAAVILYGERGLANNTTEYRGGEKGANKKGEWLLYSVFMGFPQGHRSLAEFRFHHRSCRIQI